MTREQFLKIYSQKTYIGDSVYIHFDGYHFILETINGLPDDPSNRIAIEPQVLDQFLKYRDQVYKDAKEIVQEVIAC